MKNVGIIGAGIAGLQLGLFLRSEGIATTIYTEQSAEQVRNGLLPNAVVRSGPTRNRERLLNVAHWDAADTNLTHFSLHIAGEHPLAFAGKYDSPTMCVDMRLYCAQLMKDFAQRGGTLQIGALTRDDVTRLTEAHDLLVVATGRKALTTLFPRIPEYSPFTMPQRLVVGGLYQGIVPNLPLALDLTVVPGHGEIFSYPIVSFVPDLTVLAFESITGGAFDALAHLRYADDPPHFEATVLDLLRTYAPHLFERVDQTAFALNSAMDLCHVAITPTVRAGYLRLENGRFVVALGDAHIINDPVIGQGANTASFAAWTLGEMIRDAAVADEAFCAEAERRIWAFAQPVTAGTNVRLGSPTPHLLNLVVTAARDQAVADAYAWGFNHPDQFYTALATPERTAAFLADITQPTPSVAL